MAAAGQQGGKMEHSVNIPEWALLTIAVHGNMGDGELPDMMKFWARDECKRLGLGEKLEELQEERFQEMRQRMTKVLGPEVIGKIERMAALGAAGVVAAQRMADGDQRSD